MAFPTSRRVHWLLASYVVLLHGALAFVCLKTNFRTLSAKTLGLAPPEERSVGLYQGILPWAEKARGMAPGAVVVLGDSMVKDLDPAGIGEGAEILGAGGVTISVLREAANLLGPLETAGTVVVCAGVNDLKYRSPSEVAADYLAWLNQLPEGPRILCLSVLPVDDSVAPSHGRSFISNAEIAELNQLLRSALKASQRFRFTDVQGAVLAPGGGPVAHAYQDDGWHLSAEGRRRLEVAIRDRL